MDSVVCLMSDVRSFANQPPSLFVLAMFSPRSHRTPPPSSLASSISQPSDPAHSPNSNLPSNQSAYNSSRNEKQYTSSNPATSQSSHSHHRHIASSAFMSFIQHITIPAIRSTKPTTPCKIFSDTKLPMLRMHLCYAVGLRQWTKKLPCHLLLFIDCTQRKSPAGVGGKEGL